jgi:ABC-type uncharacterized transport system substrate-binding protein
MKRVGLPFLSAAFFLCLAGLANAHPHVFVEANLEIVRNEAGDAVEIRHVWRFDELFSSSLFLDFDANGNGSFETEELDDIANTTRTSLADYHFFTDVRVSGEMVDLAEPDVFFADYQDGQLLLVLSMAFRTPQSMKGTDFRISVSDPTYYVAVDFVGDDAVLLSGGGGQCQHEIVRPDFDALYARDADKLERLFSAGPDEEVEASDDYLTWVNFTC